jgi:hypothetical protein
VILAAAVERAGGGSGDAESWEQVHVWGECPDASPIEISAQLRLGDNRVGKSMTELRDSAGPRTATLKVSMGLGDKN